MEQPRSESDRTYPCPCGGTLHILREEPSKYGKRLYGYCDDPDHESYNERIRKLVMEEFPPKKRLPNQ